MGESLEGKSYTPSTGMLDCKVWKRSIMHEWRSLRAVGDPMTRFICQLTADRGLSASRVTLLDGFLCYSAQAVGIRLIMSRRARMYVGTRECERGKVDEEDAITKSELPPVYCLVLASVSFPFNILDH